ncbi:cytochrome c oxidase assembly factor-like isoform X2 [Ptiloglossa arizonensis]|uniref:cytochrome c oxidase assembly factor-like isoform X2 n=1 Tax=Ptiloglossa arizonensis TaxID=3350558 RepID=UPI003F9F04C5
MSYTAKITFGLCCATSFGIVAYVHYKQEYDRQQLHLGVLRDIEQQERRKIQNVFYLQQQRELTKTLQKAEKQTKDQLLEAV